MQIPQNIPVLALAPDPVAFSDANPEPVPMPVLAANPVPAPVPAPFPFPNADLPAVNAVAPQPNLPLACQPFNKNWPVHNLGNINIACSDCGALHWMSEKLSGSSRIHFKFGTGCFSGSTLHSPRSPSCLRTV
jgi:hypothetical protein